MALNWNDKISLIIFFAISFKVRCPGHSSGALEYPVGARCYIRCNSGFKLEGPHARDCETGGRWNGKEPSCVREYTPPGRPYYSGT